MLLAGPDANHAQLCSGAQMGGADFCGFLTSDMSPPPPPPPPIPQALGLDEGIIEGVLSACTSQQSTISICIPHPASPIPPVRRAGVGRPELRAHIPQARPVLVAPLKRRGGLILAHPNAFPDPARPDHQVSCPPPPLCENPQRPHSSRRGGLPGDAQHVVEHCGVGFPHCELGQQWELARDPGTDTFAEPVPRRPPRCGIRVGHTVQGDVCWRMRACAHQCVWTRA
eukprot:gene5212-biopygen19195